jgi:putative polyhydroxyalkanoate system protein
MADISLTRAHQLGLAGARAAADSMVAKLDQQFNLSGDWQGNTLHFDRPGVSGKLAVSDREMQLEVSLGFLLKAMKGPIERAVHEQLDEVLAAAKPAVKSSAKPVAKSATAKARPKAK